MIGDVHVVGLKPDTCLLVDIGMDVPHGQIVTIPAERALESKDLNRAINQRWLFKLHPGPLPDPLAPSPLMQEVVSLRNQVRSLEEENRILRDRLAVFEAQSYPHDKIDAILSLLQSVPLHGTKQEAHKPDTIPSPENPESGIVEIPPPPFIPSKIRSDDMRAFIQTDISSGNSGDITEAANRLREMRRNQ